MNSLLNDSQPTYAPLLEEFSCAIEGVDPCEFRSDEITWSNTIRHGADVVNPDCIVLSGTESVYSDFDWSTIRIGEQLDVDGTSTDSIDTFVETAEILADVRDRPLLCLLPSPSTILSEQYDNVWPTSPEIEELEVLDFYHQLSQILTDIIRELGSVIDGLVLDEHGLQSILNSDITLSDVFLETGPVFNLGNHYSIPIIGLTPATLMSRAEVLNEEYDKVVLDSPNKANIETAIHQLSQLGGGIPDTMWNHNAEAFENAVRSYLDEAPDDFLFMPKIPQDVTPEKVRELSAIVN